MSAENDNGWIPLASLGAYIATFVFGALTTAFAKGMMWATVRGEAHGEIMGRLRTVEADIAMIKARKDRIDNRLENVATRDEVTEMGDRIERRVGDIDTKISRLYELRFGFPLTLPPRDDTKY